MRADAQRAPHATGRAGALTTQPAAAFLSLLAALLFAGAAQAAAISFVASTGKDSNPCSRSKPCRTLQEGVDKTSDGGDVVVLDSGFYGNNLNITKSIAISAGGPTSAGGQSQEITAALRSITINNAAASVVLRGLLLTGKGAAADTDGILISDAATVHIEDCIIERFPRHGINAFAIDTKIFVTRSAFRHNGEYGIRFVGIGSATAALTVDSSQFENNGFPGGFAGIHAGHGPIIITRSILSGNSGNGVEQDVSNVNVVWSTAANNGNNGFAVSGQADTPAELTLEHSTSRGNGFDGLSVSGNADGRARISNSVFTENSFGIRNNGVVHTRENNTIAGNLDDHNGNDLEILAPQ